MHGPIKIRFLLGKFRSRKCPVSIITRRISLLISISCFSPSSAYHLISTHPCLFHLMSPHRSLISPYLTLSHLISFILLHPTAAHLISSQLNSSHCIASHLFSPHTISSHVTSPQLTLVISQFFMLQRVK